MADAGSDGDMSAEIAGQHAMGDRLVTNGENAPNALSGRPPAPGGSGGTTSNNPSASAGNGGGQSK